MLQAHVCPETHNIALPSQGLYVALGLGPESHVKTEVGARMIQPQAKEPWSPQELEALSPWTWDLEL